MASIPQFMTLNVLALLTLGTPTTPPWSSLWHSCYIHIHKSAGFFRMDLEDGRGQIPTAVEKNANNFGGHPGRSLCGWKWGAMIVSSQQFVLPWLAVVSKYFCPFSLWKVWTFVTGQLIPPGEGGRHRNMRGSRNPTPLMEDDKILP